MTTREGGEAGGPVLHIPGWPKGWNPRVDLTALAQDELHEALNVVIGPRGELRRRPGLDTFPNTDVVPSWNGQFSGLGFEISWIVPTQTTFTHDDLSGRGGQTATYPLYISDFINNRCYLVGAVGDPAPGVLLFQADTDANKVGTVFSVVTMNNRDYLIGQNVNAFEINKPDGSQVTRTLLTAWNVTADTTNAIPNAPIVAVAYERIFVAGAKLGEDTRIAGKRLRFSDPLLPKTWKAANFIDVNPDDGQDITAIRQFGDLLIIFKEHSIWAISGTDFSSISGLSLFPLDKGIGTKHQYSIVDIGGALMFVDDEKGVFLYDGSAFHNVGEPIIEYLKENIYRVIGIRAWFIDGRYHLTYSEKKPGDFTAQILYPDRTLVYDTQSGGWSRWNSGYNSVVVISDLKERTGPHALACKVFYADKFNGIRELTHGSAHQADGSGILSTIRTGLISPSEGLQQHRFRQIMVQARPNGVTESGINTIGMIPDGGSLTAVTIDLSNGAGMDYTLVRTHGLNGKRWRHVQIVIEGGAAAPDAVEDWQIDGLTAVISSLPRIRGEQ